MPECRHGQACMLLETARIQIHTQGLQLHAILPPRFAPVLASGDWFISGHRLLSAACRFRSDYRFDPYNLRSGGTS